MGYVPRVRRSARGLGPVAWGAVLLLLAGCGASEDRPGADDQEPSTPPPTSISPTPSATEEPDSNFDWSAPPEYVRFRGWAIERFPVPRGSQPTTEEGRRGDFSAYVVFTGGDVERISAFYARVLRREGYAIDVDDYGTVRFAGGGVEGGVVESRGDVAVVINRAST
jgi:hypothetical protein